MNHVQVQKFFEYARERYMIFQKRQADQPKPWTHDPILQKYRFCNVFREDDKVTVWFRENVRNPLRSDAAVVMACIVFRYVNCIPTGEKLLRAGLFHRWNSSEFAAVMKQIKDSGKPMLGAAYMIKTPNGKNKITGLREIFSPFGEFSAEALAAEFQGCDTLQEAVEWLTTFHYVGPFMAYEIACDLMFTDFFKPVDRYTWANPGPGAKRGLCRLMNSSGHLTQNFARLPADDMQSMMRMLLAAAGRVDNWYGHWPRWEMRTVEHTLCEYDKYMRAFNGEGTPKQKYEGT